MPGYDLSYPNPHKSNIDITVITTSTTAGFIYRHRRERF
jgi:hypothetical protein